MNFNLNFPLKSNKIISGKFQELEISDFHSASIFIKNLPYKRNSDKENSINVFQDLGGTCSTKHALLKNLASENNITELRLMLGIFRMNQFNTPKISNVLEKYKVKEMPEAHNYLKFQNEILDCTRKNSSSEDFIDDLLLEIEIQTSQITDFKIQYHQKFLANYLQENPQIPYSLSEFWEIREECIATLQQ